MSWEDCGFKPGKIHGPPKCPKGACDACDGEHHFLVSHIDEDDPDKIELPEGFDPLGFFECKHCPAIADMVHDEESDVFPDDDEPPLSPASTIPERACKVCHGEGKVEAKGELFGCVVCVTCSACGGSGAED